MYARSWLCPLWLGLGYWPQEYMSVLCATGLGRAAACHNAVVVGACHVTNHEHSSWTQVTLSQWIRNICREVGMCLSFYIFLAQKQSFTLAWNSEMLLTLMRYNLIGMRCGCCSLTLFCFMQLSTRSLLSIIYFYLPRFSSPPSLRLISFSHHHSSLYLSPAIILSTPCPSRLPPSFSPSHT